MFQRNIIFNGGIPKLVEGTGLENRKVAQAARGFESYFLRHLFLIFIYRGVEQLVARRAHNPKAVGPNPTPATKWFRSAVVNTSACHAEDRGSDPRRNRQLWLCSSVGRAED